MIACIRANQQSTQSTTQQPNQQPPPTTTSQPPLSPIQAVIFVVDASTPDRFPVARHELQSLVSEPLLRDALWLVLANKADAPGAASGAAVAEALGLAGLTPRGALWCCVASCALTGEGLREGLAWIEENLDPDKM
jgi:ADP-ribosylation factor protein 6